MTTDTFSKKIKQWSSDKLHEMTVDWTNVAPKQNFTKGRFFLISPAGIIIYKPKTEVDISRFRNKWLGTFDSIARIPDVEIRANAFFKLYMDIMRVEKCKYKANWRTRWNLFRLS